MAKHYRIQINRDEVMRNLEEFGYAVIPNVLTEEVCDQYIKEYKDWLTQIEESDLPLMSSSSLIQGYRIGHLNASWSVRLKVKDVFEQIWQTDKLLSSVDAVALSRPPEEGCQKFAKPGEYWLHLDQGAHKKGVHAYQSGVYLEESSDTDYCFRVLAKSHKEQDNFSAAFPKYGEVTKDVEYYQLTSKERDWYMQTKGCQLTKVPVPKGGMVLWDSRTVHDNVKPEQGRQHIGRWRHVVFVCMTPAAWATPKDIALKQNAYDNLLLTTHWPSRDVSTFRAYPYESEMSPLKELPDIAKTKEAKLLMGVEEYDFKDGLSNGPPIP